MGGVSVEELTRLGIAAGEPVFAGAPHHLISYEMAPAKFQLGISRLLEFSSFETNVFCMTRFPSGSEDPVAAAINICKSTCDEIGLDLHLASDAAVDDVLFENVGAYMWGCQFGVAILESHPEKGLNYNVAFETGGMLATGRRCLLLKDKTAPKELFTDLIAHLYKPVDLDDPATVRAAVREWAESDLGLRS
jgi:hypothetical protein